MRLTEESMKRTGRNTLLILTLILLVPLHTKADEPETEKQKAENQKAENQEAWFSILPEAQVQPEPGMYDIIEALPDPVIETGSGWESKDVLNPSVIEYRGRLYNYYSGWDGQVWRTGLAVSSDGSSWEKNGDFLLDLRENDWDNTYIAANGSAICAEDQVFYYYQSVDRSDGKTKIGLAISPDGYDFSERMPYPVLEPGQKTEWDSRAVADPCVISFGGKYYMYYLGEDRLGVQRLGAAVSDDGRYWTKYQNNPILELGAYGSFDENGLGEPGVIYKAPYFYMIYTGRNRDEYRNLGMAVSLDGVNWKKLHTEGFFPTPEEGWNSAVVCDPSLLEDTDGTVRVWYGGGNIASPDENLNGQIGMFRLGFNTDGSCVSSFDANTWDNSQHSSVSYIPGSYKIEGEEGSRYAWMSDNACVTLKNDSSRPYAILKGRVSRSLFEGTEIKTLTVDTFVNGEYAASSDELEDGEFEIIIDKSGVTDPCITIQMKASGHVNLLEAGLGRDDRDLSWILYSIRQEP